MWLSTEGKGTRDLRVTRECSAVDTAQELTLALETGCGADKLAMALLQAA